MKQLQKVITWLNLPPKNNTPAKQNAAPAALLISKDLFWIKHVLPLPRLFLQGPAAGSTAAEPPQLAALFIRLQPPPVLTLHPGGGAGHPALHPAPAEDSPAGAAAGRGPEPPLGGRGRGSPQLRNMSGTGGSTLIAYSLICASLCVKNVSMEDSWGREKLLSGKACDLVDYDVRGDQTKTSQHGDSLMSPEIKHLCISFDRTELTSDWRDRLWAHFLLFTTTLDEKNHPRFTGSNHSFFRGGATHSFEYLISRLQAVWMVNMDVVSLLMFPLLTEEKTREDRDYFAIWAHWRGKVT